MAVSYDKLWKLLIDKHLKKTDLIKISGISSNVLAKMGKNQNVSIYSLERICNSLHCDINQILEFVSDKKGVENEI
jgi:DNA-binding Xre family transcriptional regulator